MMAWTLKHDLEPRVSETLKVTHKVMLWLIGHAFNLVNRIQVGQGGKTSFERVKGKLLNGDIVRFANPVMMRVAGKVQGGFMPEWRFEGLFMGMRLHTNEAVVMQLSDGMMVGTGLLQRAVTLEMLNKLVGVPWIPPEWLELELMVGITGVNASLQIRFQTKMLCQ